MLLTLLGHCLLFSLYLFAAMHYCRHKWSRQGCDADDILVLISASVLLSLLAWLGLAVAFVDITLFFVFKGLVLGNVMAITIRALRKKRIHSHDAQLALVAGLLALASLSAALLPPLQDTLLPLTQQRYIALPEHNDSAQQLVRSLLAQSDPASLAQSGWGAPLQSAWMMLIALDNVQGAYLSIASALQGLLLLAMLLGLQALYPPLQRRQALLCLLGMASTPAILSLQLYGDATLFATYWLLALVLLQLTHPARPLRSTQRAWLGGLCLGLSALTLLEPLPVLLLLGLWLWPLRPSRTDAGLALACVLLPSLSWIALIQPGPQVTFSLPGLAELPAYLQHIPSLLHAAIHSHAPTASLSAHIQPQALSGLSIWPLAALCAGLWLWLRQRVWPAPTEMVGLLLLLLLLPAYHTGVHSSAALLSAALWLMLACLSLIALHRHALTLITFLSLWLSLWLFLLQGLELNTLSRSWLLILIVSIWAIGRCLPTSTESSPS